MVISIVNQKGGVGKTTTVVNLGAALAQAGKQVLVVDLDQQRDLSAFESAFETPGLVKAQAGASSLPKVLEQPHDYALLDCPPALGKEAAAALKAAQLALVPVNAEFSALRGLSRLLETMAAARGAGNLLLRHKILLTMLDVRAGHCRDIESEAQALLGRDLLATRIRRSYAFADAAQAGQSILQHAPRSRGAQAYRELAQEILGL